MYRLTFSWALLSFFWTFLAKMPVFISAMAARGLKRWTRFSTYGGGQRSRRRMGGGGAFKATHHTSTPALTLYTTWTPTSTRDLHPTILLLVIVGYVNTHNVNCLELQDQSASLSLSPSIARSLRQRVSTVDSLAASQIAACATRLKSRTALSS